jgi:formyltetrahydrofolate deformylase
MPIDYIVTVSCADRPGIVRSVAEAIFAVDGNIVESAQFSDLDAGTFSLRILFETDLDDEHEVRTAIAQRLPEADVFARRADARPRVMIMVSQHDHCLVDLLYRHRIGELAVDIPVVVSNHEDCRAVVEQHGIAYRHIPVSADTKADAERAMLDLVASERIDFVVLARYMQVLSDEVCAPLAGRIINIHHSFLPGFAGASPYRQAHDRGVKLIGATAHYVTAELDEGPIIEQDVVRVSHTQSVAELTALGRDVERRVLARAVRLHAEHRVMRTGLRTVVFS